MRVRPQGSTLDTDLGQEFRVYSLLMDEPVPTPDVTASSLRRTRRSAGRIFVMDRVEGHAPNVWRRRDREALEADWSAGRGIADDLADNLAAIHAIDAGPRRAGRDGPRLRRDGRPLGRASTQEMRLVADPVVERGVRLGARSRAGARRPCARPRRLPDRQLPDRRRPHHRHPRLGAVLRRRPALRPRLHGPGLPRRQVHVTPGSQLLNAVAERDWFHERYAAALRARRSTPRSCAPSPALGALMLFAIMTTGIRVYDRRRHDRHPHGLGPLRRCRGCARTSRALMGW